MRLGALSFFGLMFALLIAFWLTSMEMRTHRLPFLERVNSPPELSVWVMLGAGAALIGHKFLAPAAKASLMLSFGNKLSWRLAMNRLVRASTLMMTLFTASLVAAIWAIVMSALIKIAAVRTRPARPPFNSVCDGRFGNALLT